MSENEINSLEKKLLELSKLDMNLNNNEEFIENAIKLLKESGHSFPEIKM